jgi:hypothetical protein
VTQSRQPSLGFFQDLLDFIGRLFRPPAPPQQENHGLLHHLSYFVPGHILMLAEYDEPLEMEYFLKLLQANPIVSSNRFLGTALSESLRRALAFPGTEATQPIEGRPGARRQRPFSLVFVDVPELRASPAKLLQFVAQVNRQIRARPGDSQGQVVLSAISPNWLAGAAGHNGSVGGPGARPIPDTSVLAAGPDLPVEAVFTLPINLPTQAGEGIDIAILDTAPDQEDIERAFTEWSATNPLVNRLLGGQLQISYAGNTHLLGTVNVDLVEHPYTIADHGLFVAGVINSIAPQASLHLIEVLNPYGVGTVETLADGLARLLPRNSDRPLVINCSLMITIPFPEHARKIPGAEDPPDTRNLEALDLLGMPLDLVFNALRGQHIFIVAAAGNDNPTLQNNPPPARQPAAFGSVFGIGALIAGQQPQPAEYSNISDTPVVSGIATFGGDTTGAPPHRSASIDGGMLGVYIGEFPDEVPGATLPNKNGWARWAGTSFATPIMTGTLAALLSGQSPAKDLEQRLRDAENQVYGAISGSTSLGHTFHVKQG